MNEFTLYLDESGDHRLDRIDPAYPVFVLGGVIIRDADHAEIEAKLRRFKGEYCGNEQIILHTADITRNRNGFELLKDTRERERFYGGMNDLMRGLPYQVVAVVVRKAEHRARYGDTAADPYHLALSFLVERFCRFLSGRNGRIVAESRNPTLDGRLEVVYEELLLFGTRYSNGPAIARALPRPLEILPKSRNIAGLQLADLVITPIGRHTMGKRDKEDWTIIEGRFRRGPNGNYLGYGLKVFP